MKSLLRQAIILARQLYPTDKLQNRNPIARLGFFEAVSVLGVKDRLEDCLLYEVRIVFRGLLYANVSKILV